MASVAPPLYAIHSTPHLKWTATQEKGLNCDYPFTDLHLETPEQYVQRTYLQFLWLPESIMPLELLIPSLQRVNTPSSSSSNPSQLHPLHPLLDQLLLTVSSSRAKYTIELPQILSDGGGAGEAEETMMWFTLNYEKADGDDEKTRAEGPWVNDLWRKKWLERLEKREVLIQILLCLLKLSLPQPDEPEGSPKKKKRKRETTMDTEATESLFDRFTDKLAAWQYFSGEFDVYATNRNVSSNDDRDWMQVFCEDIVEPAFKTKTPEMTNLLRSKIFRDSSNPNDGSSTRSNSPTYDDDTLRVSQKRSLSGASNPSRYDSPTSSTHRKRKKTATDRSTSSSFARSRSRSLSVSLAQDPQRAGSVGATKKRTLNREVSMSRVFKEKEKPPPNTDTKKATSGPVPDAKPITEPDQGVMLVEATPVKAKKRVQLLSARTPFQSSELNGQEEEEDWSIVSSRDVLLQKIGQEKLVANDKGQILAGDTPVKKKKN